MGKLSQAKIDANKRWDVKNLETLGLKLRKGTKERWAKYAEANGTSITKLIQAAMEEKAEREGYRIIDNTGGEETT